MHRKIRGKKGSNMTKNVRAYCRSLLRCTTGCILLFVWRKGEVSPLFALADAFSVSGFFTWLVCTLPALLRSEAFDASSYMARSVLSGFFPSFTKGYNEHQRERASRRAACRSSCREACPASRPEPASEGEPPNACSSELPNGFPSPGSFVGAGFCLFGVLLSVIFL